MDGTFLNDEKTYDRERFLSIKQEMEKQQMHFVVASGNQYWRLVDYFPDLGEQLFYIADNGADIRYHSEQVRVKTIAKEFHRPLLNYLKDELPDHRLVLSGKKGVYIHHQLPQDFVAHVKFFYRHITQIDLQQPIPDDIFKFALNFPAEQLANANQQLHDVFGEELTVVTSGHQALDIISNSAGKEVGIRELQKKFQLNKDEIAVFGDNMNDVGMFREVTHSYAMGNALLPVKEAASQVIGSNNEQAVLDKIEEFFIGGAVDGCQAVKSSN
nr:Cof-type HAD-IIB family hydrolase [Enterococcus italicus]